jgi:hypothetical protein
VITTRVRFTFRGIALAPTDTLASLGVRDGDVIDVLSDQDAAGASATLTNPNEWEVPFSAQNIAWANEQMPTRAFNLGSVIPVGHTRQSWFGTNPALFTTVLGEDGQTAPDEDGPTWPIRETALYVAPPPRRLRLLRNQQQGVSYASTAARTVVEVCHWKLNPARAHCHLLTCATWLRGSDSQRLAGMARAAPPSDGQQLLCRNVRGGPGAPNRYGRFLAV